MTGKCDFHYNEKRKSGQKYALEKYFSEEIQEFHKTLPGYTPTPVAEIGLTIKNYRGKVLIKDESKRFSPGAFKSLGASWAIHDFLKNHPGEFTFCTATDGNHGRAVAWSSRIFGQKSKVFMPLSTVESRKKFIEDEGAIVTILDGDYDFAVNMARKESLKENHILIQDTAWEGYEHYPNLISAAYSTMLRELEYQIRDFNDNRVDVIILQSGVGSWAASVILYLRKILSFQKTKLIILEPLESDCLLESSRQGRISTTRKSQKTIMAGLNCGTPSLSAWEIISDLADAFVSIDDSYTLKAMKILAAEGYETCESGAAGMAGVIALYQSKNLLPLKTRLGLNENSRFLVFNTEGITDPEMFRKVVGSD